MQASFTDVPHPTVTATSAPGRQAERRFGYMDTGHGSWVFKAVSWGDPGDVKEQRVVKRDAYRQLNLSPTGRYVAAVPPNGGASIEPAASSADQIVAFGKNDLAVWSDRDDTLCVVRNFLTLEGGPPKVSLVNTTTRQESPVVTLEPDPSVRVFALNRCSVSRNRAVLVERGISATDQLTVVRVLTIELTHGRALSTYDVGGEHSEVVTSNDGSLIGVTTQSNTVSHSVIVDLASGRQMYSSEGVVRAIAQDDGTVLLDRTDAISHTEALEVVRMGDGLVLFHVNGNSCGALAAPAGNHGYALCVREPASQSMPMVLRWTPEAGSVTLAPSGFLT